MEADATDFVDVKTAAKMANYSIFTIRRLIKGGKLKARQLPGGRKLAIRRSDVVALMEGAGAPRRPSEPQAERRTTVQPATTQKATPKPASEWAIGDALRKALKL